MPKNFLIPIVLLGFVAGLILAPKLEAQRIGTTVNLSGITPIQAVGAVTVNGAVVVSSDLSGWGGVAVQLTGTCTGCTANFEGSVDGTNYVSLAMQALGGSTAVTSASAAGAWTASVPGVQRVRVRLSAYTSGSFIVTLRGGLAGSLR